MGKWRYGVILDAGSSGTRLHIYRWEDHKKARKEASKKELGRLPVIKTKKHWTKKIHPGVSTFGTKPELVGPDHLKGLFDHAKTIIDKEDMPETPIYLLATAGMRLLPTRQKQDLLDQICAYARASTDFLLPDCDAHIQVIPGETEGLYGWIAANYLLGGFDAPEEHAHGKGHHTYGFLDMGGASAQIAFAPNATEAERHANDLKLLRMRTLDGAPQEYKVFVTTWLEFGVNEARRRYVEGLVNTSYVDGIERLPDPCLPRDLQVTTKGVAVAHGKEQKDQEPYLIGTGHFDECLRATYPLLDKDAPCEDQPCLLHGVHVPSIDFDVNHFIGVSEYWHTTHEVFEMDHKGKSYDFNTYQSRVMDFCGKKWEDIQDGIDDKKWGKKVDEKTASEVCFKASWLINVLHNGIGIPRVGLEDTKGSGHNGTVEVLEHLKEKGYLDPFRAVDKIDDVEVSWTLGKMVLYASSKIPPVEPILPVGFGSNIKTGIPSDFQYGGSKSSSPSSGGNETFSYDESDAPWHDTLFNKDSPRRIPGFLLFLFILGFAVFLLLGRDRRSKVYRRISTAFGRPSGFGGKRRKLFSSNGIATYERVLEEGEHDVTGTGDFELGDVDSDHSDSSSGGSMTGRSSGWHTPRLKPGVSNASTGGAYFDKRPHSRPQSAGISGGFGLPSPGILSNPMDRSGLVVRTESRERLAPMSAGLPGKRSRATSPTRKSPLMPLTGFQDKPLD